MQRQLLWLMYLLSKDSAYLHVPVRETRSTDKIVFKVPSRILPIHEHSPYFIGIKLWSDLPKDVQCKENVYVFKKKKKKKRLTECI